MPVYEYECLTCHTHFERMQHFDDPPLQRCPRGHHNVRRLFSPPAIVFKGSGFYVTDHRQGNNGGNKKSDEKETAESKKEE